MITFVHFGSDRHGVTRYGQLIQQMVGSSVPACGIRVRVNEPEAVLDRPVHSTGVVHFQYSDSLLPGCAGRLQKVLSTVDSKTVVTLHDVPGLPGQDPGWSAGRIDEYRAVAEAADQVITCSEHERRAVAQWSSVAPAVIPHVVEARRAPVHMPAGDGRVGILGYVYPDKGHAQAIDACALLGWQPGVVAIGAIGPGHEGLAAALSVRAERAGVDFHITGWLDELRFNEALFRTAVPVAGHQIPSASGSVATWMSAGRQPIATANGYTRELAAMEPSSLHLVEPPTVSGLARSIERALTNPPTTWLRSITDCWTPERVAALHLQMYGRMLGVAQCSS